MDGAILGASTPLPDAPLPSCRLLFCTDIHDLHAAAVFVEHFRPLVQEIDSLVGLAKYVQSGAALTSVLGVCICTPARGMFL